jgi:hypothetical protein
MCIVDFQDLRQMPLHGRLLDLRNLAEQPAPVRPEPARLLPTDLLQGITRPHPHNLVVAAQATKQLPQAAPVGQHGGDHLLGPAERVGCPPVSACSKLISLSRVSRLEAGHAQWCEPWSLLLRMVLFGAQGLCLGRRAD